MRLMGANIGRNVSVSPSTDIAEFDLITINNGATIDEIAKDQNFDLIVYQGVAYASPKIDITDQIIKALGK